MVCLENFSYPAGRVENVDLNSNISVYIGYLEYIMLLADLSVFVMLIRCDNLSLGNRIIN